MLFRVLELKNVFPCNAVIYEKRNKLNRSQNRELSYFSIQGWNEEEVNNVQQDSPWLSVRAGRHRAGLDYHGNQTLLVEAAPWLVNSSACQNPPKPRVVSFSS